MFQANYDGNKRMVPIRNLFSKIMKRSRRYNNKFAENLDEQTIIINHFRITKECAILEGNGLIIIFMSLFTVFGIYSRVMNS